MLPFKPVTSSNDLFSEVRIVRIIRETADAATFELEGESIGSFKAGQFITFVVPTRTGLVRRSYSFSSSPGERPAITVKRLSNGILSRTLMETAEPGDRLTIAGGPSGFFVLPEKPEEFSQIMFLAAGSGITPVYSLIKALAGMRMPVPAVLAYSNSSPARTLFREPLEKLAKQHPRLAIEWFFSDRQDLMRARLSKASLEQLMTTRAAAEPERMLAYLCGPFDYMRMAAIVLQARGVPPENIRREVFTPDLVKGEEHPPDVGAHRVTLLFRGHRHEFTVQYPNTILAEAKLRNIELPYSCEAGRCGSCIAACTSGKVWMRYNEVLTDKEVNLGRVLTCQAFPVGGDVTIEYF